MVKREYRVVQPWGNDRARESTEISSHPSADAAFAAIDRAAEQMARTGVRTDAVELIVIDEQFRIVPRRDS